MKKYISTIFAVAALVASCTEFVQDPEIEFKDITAPAVEALTVSDTEISVTVTPAEGTTFYSYLVTKGKAQELDPATLLKCKYDALALTVGEDKIFDLVEVKDEPSVVSLTLTGLTPYTDYTVYAVATNAQGVVSTVASATALTTDGTAPKFAKAGAEESDSVMVFTIQFDDPVALNDGAVVTAQFGALNATWQDINLGTAESPVPGKLLIPFKQETISAENVSDEGGVITVTIPKELYIPGAVVCLNLSEGAVKNATDQTSKALSSAMLNVNNSLTPSGAVGQYENVSFDLALTEEDVDTDFGEEEEEEPEPEKFNDWTKFAATVYARTEHQLYGPTRTADVEIVVNDASARTISYKTDKFAVGADKKTVLVSLKEDPGFGSLVSFTIAAGSVQDIYGNTNNAFSVDKGYFNSYGYTLDDIVGNYNVNALKYNFETGAQEPYATALKIAASDDETQGNVKITDYFGIPCELYCTFDMDGGTLTILEWTMLTEIQYGDAPANLLHSSYSEEDLVLNMKTPGELSEPSDMFGAYMYVSPEVQGYYFMFTDLIATRTPSEEQASSSLENLVLTAAAVKAKRLIR